MENINQLSPMSSWPTRADPQERFDEQVQEAMNRMSDLTQELNSDFIPKVNTLQSEIQTELNKKVNNSGNETISGTKTFTDSPNVPTPETSDNSKKVVNSEYVRNLFTGAGYTSLTQTGGGEYFYKY